MDQGQILRSKKAAECTAVVTESSSTDRDRIEGKIEVLASPGLEGSKV